MARQGCSLLLRNLRFETSPDRVRQIFEKFGRVRDVYLPLDHYTKRPRGFGFVEFYDEKDAKEALREMDKTLLDGNEISVIIAQDRRKSPETMRRYLEQGRAGGRGQDREMRNARGYGGGERGGGRGGGGGGGGDYYGTRGSSSSSAVKNNRYYGEPGDDGYYYYYEGGGSHGRSSNSHRGAGGGGGYYSPSHGYGGGGSWGGRGGGGGRGPPGGDEYFGRSSRSRSPLRGGGGGAGPPAGLDDMPPGAAGNACVVGTAHMYRGGGVGGSVPQQSPAGGGGRRGRSPSPRDLHE